MFDKITCGEHTIEYRRANGPHSIGVKFDNDEWTDISYCDYDVHVNENGWMEDKNEYYTSQFWFNRALESLTYADIELKANHRDLFEFRLEEAKVRIKNAILVSPYKDEEDDIYIFETMSDMVMMEDTDKRVDAMGEMLDFFNHTLNTRRQLKELKEATREE